MQYETIQFSIRANVGQIRLNRPKAFNAINTKMFLELTDAFQASADNGAVRAVLLSAEGRAFCAGGDIKEMVQGMDRTPQQLQEHVRNFTAMASALIDLTKPVVCAVQGAAAGAGFSLALACDVIFATEDAAFSQAFAQVGLIPDAGSTYLLPRVVGRSRAKELIFSHRVVRATEARELGIVSRIVPAGELYSAAFETAAEYARGPAFALGLAKRLVNHSFEQTVSSALAEEISGQYACLRTPDYVEGVAAFLEKRQPQFTGTQEA